MNKIDKENRTRPIFVFLFIITTSIFCSYYGQPLLKGNKDAISILVNLFSILSGVIIAVTTLISDSFCNFTYTNSRIAKLGKDEFFKRLEKHRIIFLCYLTTLLLIFIATLFKGKFSSIIEHLYLFFGSFSLLYSFSLPSTIIKQQKDRIERIIKDNK